MSSAIVYHLPRLCVNLGSVEPATHFVFPAKLAFLPFLGFFAFCRLLRQCVAHKFRAHRFPADPGRTVFENQWSCAAFSVTPGTHSGTHPGTHPRQTIPRIGTSISRSEHFSAGTSMMSAISCSNLLTGSEQSGGEAGFLGQLEIDAGYFWQAGSRIVYNVDKNVRIIISFAEMVV